MFDFLSQKFFSIFAHFKGESKLTEANIQEALKKVHDALLEADVPYEVVEKFSAEIGQEVVGKKLTASLRPSEMLLKIVHDKLLAFMGGTSAQEGFVFDLPSVVMVMGLQGSGKTTTIAKLAHYVQEIAKKEAKRVK